MAIAFDAKSQSSAGAANQTWAHTCTGSNLILYVSISNNTNSDGISGVTYAGVAMTRVGMIFDGLAGRGYLYRLLAPATGSNNIIVTRSNSDYISCSAASYSGVQQSTTNFVSNTQASNASTNVNTLTTLVANCWLVSADVNEGGTASSAGAGAYLRQSGANIFNVLYDSNAAIATAGSTSMTINQTGGNFQAGTIMEAFAPATGPIAFDAATNSGETSAGSKTWSHTVTGSNTILFVNGYIRGNGNSCTGVTYNGIAMTQIGVQAYPDTAYYDYLFGFYLINPPTGAHNVVASFSSSNYNDCNSISYTGVRQTANLDAFIDSTQTGNTTITDTLTSTANNSWGVLMGEMSGGTATQGAGATLRIGTGAHNPSIFDSNGAWTPAGSHSMSVAHTDNFSSKMVTIAPADTTIAFDANSNGATASSWSHTCTGSNRLLLVGVVGDTTDVTPTVTYNSVAMTQINKVGMPSDRWLYLYYLLAPATGSNTVAISGPSYIRGVATSYTGVSQVSPDANGTATSASSPISKSITTVASNTWVMSFAGAGGAISAAGTGTTSRGGGSFFIMGDTNGSNPIPGSITQTWTGTGSAYGICCASFAPYSAAKVNILVVAGGGGCGTTGPSNGGGGAGGYIASPSYDIDVTKTYAVTVGAQGSQAPDTAHPGVSGGNSNFDVLTAIGGGGGGCGSGSGAAATSGGSGGGAGGTGSGAAGVSGQGYSGANNTGSVGGGGGGAGAAGSGSTGGAGIANSISGSSVTYAGGGAGYNGGTNGSGYDQYGGGMSGNTGAKIKDGVVIIAYPTDGSAGITTNSTGGTITTSGSNTIHTFTASGTFTPSNVSVGDSVSVYDSSAVTESTTLLIPTYYVNVYDSSAVTESVTLLKTSFINIYDSSAVTESVTLLKTSYINVYDSSAVTESVTIQNTTATIPVFDSSAVTEVVSLMKISYINVFDSSAVTESVTIQNSSASINVFDSSAVTESVTLLKTSFINVYDSSAVTESTTLLIPTYYVNVYDSSAVTESVTLNTTSYINVYDSSAVTESVTMNTTSYLNVYDSSAVTESNTASIVASINVFDSSSVTESISLINTKTINVYDSSVVTENSNIISELVIGPYLGGQAQVVCIGGGGGGGLFGGGGGAGGYAYIPNYPIYPATYTVQVGGGGAGDTTPSGTGGLGGLSYLEPGSMQGLPGGGGGSRNSAPYAGNNGADGGSGGGGSGTDDGNQTYGGIGSQGNNGGRGSLAWSAGGGGGAGSVGGSWAANNYYVTGKPGGDGVVNPIAGSTTGQNISGVYWLAGGGGGSLGGAAGGKGGGGASTTTTGIFGTANTGGGGGAGDTVAGGDGGSGVVIISYPTAVYTCTGGTITTYGSNTIHTFTTIGKDSFVVSSAPSSDGSQVTENVSMFIPYLTLSVYDSSSVTENFSGNTSSDTLTVFDSSVVTESIAVSIISVAINTYDSSVVTDASNIAEGDDIGPYEFSTVTDYSSVMIQSKISVSDSSTVTENITMGAIDVSISVYDYSTVTENSSVGIREATDFINVYDSSTVTDVCSISISYIYPFSTFDSSTVTESVTMVSSGCSISVFDSSVATDSPTLNVTGSSIAVFDSSAVTESITIRSVLLVGVSDSSTVTDAANLHYGCAFTTFDSSVVTENITVGTVNCISPYDSVTVSDAVGITIYSESQWMWQYKPIGSLESSEMWTPIGDINNLDAYNSPQGSAAPGEDLSYWGDA